MWAQATAQDSSQPRKLRKGTQPRGQGKVQQSSDDRQGEVKQHGLGEGPSIQVAATSDQDRAQGLAEGQGKGQGRGQGSAGGQGSEQKGKDVQAAASDGPAAAVLLSGSDPTAQEVTSRPGAFAIVL